MNNYKRTRKKDMYIITFTHKTKRNCKKIHYHEEEEDEDGMNAYNITQNAKLKEYNKVDMIIYKKG